MKNYQSMFYKIYSWFLAITTIMFFGGVYLAWDFMPNWLIIDIVAFILSILGYFCFYFNKKILTQKFWKIFFLINLPWQIFSSFIPPPKELLEMHPDMTIGWLGNTISLVLFVPLLFALYLYAFKKDSIWSGNNRLNLKQLFSKNNILATINRNTSKLWKILFWIFVIISIPILLLSFQSTNVWVILDLIILVPVILAFYAFCWQKKIFNRLFWKIFFVLNIVLINIPFHLLPDLASKNFYWQLLNFIVIFNIFILPRFFALYLYAFKSERIWQDDKDKK